MTNKEINLLKRKLSDNLSVILSSHWAEIDTRNITNVKSILNESCPEIGKCDLNLLFIDRKVNSWHNCPKHFHLHSPIDCLTNLICNVSEISVLKCECVTKMKFHLIKWKMRNFLEKIFWLCVYVEENFVKFYCFRSTAKRIKHINETKYLSLNISRQLTVYYMTKAYWKSHCGCFSACFNW